MPELITAADPPSGRGVLERYAEWLPLTPATPRITLGEGDTPLVRAASWRRAPERRRSG